MNTLTWAEAKMMIDDGVPFKYYQKSGNYFIILSVLGAVFQAFIPKDDPRGADQAIFEDEYQHLSVVSTADPSGRVITRNAATIKGWHYRAMSFVIGIHDASVQCQDGHGNDLSNQFVTELITSKRTKIIWSPNYDYEIVSGNLYQKSEPTEAITMWAQAGASTLGVPGVKEFITNLRLDMVGKHIKSDGRASKLFKQDIGIPGVKANEFIFIFDNPMEVNHFLNVSIETFQE